jgi:multidrug resistance efflux pump
VKHKSIILTVGALFLLVGAVYIYRYWYENEHYVQTENAYVSGSLVQVGSPTGGRVLAINAEIGQEVNEGDVLARVAVPVVSAVAGSNASLARYYEAANLTSEATAPITGLVVAKPASVGDTLAAGQAVVTLVDPGALWVVANVEETKVGRVKQGQPVDVHVDMLGKTLQGKVEAVTPATAALFSFLPAQNSTGNFTKVTQVVPVKISVDYSGYSLYPGTSVRVSIRVKE